MSPDTREWWGFQLRLPTGYDPKPLSRSESLAGTLLVGMFFLLSWYVFILVVPDSVLEALYGTIGPRYLVPAVVAGLSVAIGLLKPTRLLRAMGLEALLILSREKGAIGRWDFLILGLSLVVAGLSLWRLNWTETFTELILVGQVAAISLVFLRFQERVEFAKRRWKFEVPDWLRAYVDEEGRLTDDEDGRLPVQPVRPPADAYPVFTFAGRGEEAYRIGVVIPPELLDHLREVNAKADGRLYHRAPEAVVYMDRDPLTLPAPEGPLVQMCKQILAHAVDQRWTRFRLASEVLRWVQEGFTYAYDIDSTGSIPGGPFQEYGRFPLETIHDRVGDCECTSILAAGLLVYLGFDAALVHVVLHDEATNEEAHHMVVGLEAQGLMHPFQAEYLDDVDYLRDPQDVGRSERYLYGETACDDHTIEWGVVPKAWQDLMRIRKVDHLPRVRI
jgi:hypothetical protein